MLLEILEHTLLDSLKVLPFLFLTYLALEYLEEKLEEKSVNLVHKSRRWGPVIGSALGIIPQCGFSAAASSLYSGGVISMGTLVAVFLSTSDEMLPIFISQQVEPLLILKILGFKFFAALAAGLVIDLFLRSRPRTIHEMCEQEGCHCEEGIWKSAIRHTLKIYLFLLAVSFVVSLAVHLVGEENLALFILNKPFIGELLSGIIGLIPNCAASVVITQLYLQGGMSAGAMLSGLLVGAGVGVLMLFRTNRSWKENLTILGLLYGAGVLLGFLGGLLPIF